MPNFDIKGLEKYSLYSNIEKASELPLEKAEFLGIPPEDKRQPDLGYFTSIFVSSGFNLNAAYFLPSELIVAKNTIANKPLDIEHEENKIVGHLNSFAFSFKDGSLFDADSLVDKVGADVNKLDIDILTASTVYKARFPEVVEKIESGDYKVSMECYYRDFDIIVNDIIIPKEEAVKLGLVEVVGSTIKLMDVKRSLGEHKVGKVLRSMLFAGCGLVKTPANPDSVILETAARKDFTLDLHKVESYMKNKQSKESIVIFNDKPTKKDASKMGSKELSAAYGGQHGHTFNATAEETFMDGSHYHMVMSDNVPEDCSVYFCSDGVHRHSMSGGKCGPESEHKHVVYIEIEDEDEHSMYAVETSGAIKDHKHEIAGMMNKPISMDEGDMSMSPKDSTCCGDDVTENGYTSIGGAHYHELTLKDGTVIKTVMPSDMMKTKKRNMEDDMMEENKKKEGASVLPGTVNGNPPNTPDSCVNFKRYVYGSTPDNPGVPSDPAQTESIPIPTSSVSGGDDQGPNSKVVHENWCSLFDTACTSLGGCANHPDCLRMVLGRVTKEAVSSYYERLEENRSKAGVSKVLSSLNKVLEEVSNNK